MTTKERGAERIVDGLLTLLDESRPRAAFFGLYEYRTLASGSTVDLEPTDTAIGLPALAGRSVQPTAMGERVTLRDGQIVIVAFINGDPSRARIVFGDSGNTAQAIQIDAGDVTDTDAVKLGNGLLRVLRDGDLVSFAGFGPSAITLAPGLVPPLCSKVKA
jgi:hypothetical protein